MIESTTATAALRAIRPSFATPALRAIALILIAGFAASFAQARLVVMHGYADVTSALVWVQAEAPGPIRIAWRADGADREQAITLEAKAAQEAGMAEMSAKFREGGGEIDVVMES